MAGKYTAEGILEACLTTELNGLANAGISAAGPSISNDATGERDFFGNFELYIAAQGTNRTAGAACHLYLIPEVDDVNYGSTVGACLDNYYRGPVSIDDGALAFRTLIFEDVKLPVGDFKCVIKNSTGQTLAATGNTLKFRRHAYEDA